MTKELRLLRELENVVRYCHARSYDKIPERTESAVLDALEKLRSPCGCECHEFKTMEHFGPICCPKGRKEKKKRGKK